MFKELTCLIPGFPRTTGDTTEGFSAGFPLKFGNYIILSKKKSTHSYLLEIYQDVIKTPILPRILHFPTFTRIALDMGESLHQVPQL